MQLQLPNVENHEQFIGYALEVVRLNPTFNFTEWVIEDMQGIRVLAVPVYSKFKADVCKLAEKYAEDNGYVSLYEFLLDLGLVATDFEAITVMLAIFHVNEI